MSDYASVVDRARKAFASVARLEAELTRAPDNPGLQVNLAAMNKLAHQSQQQLFSISEYQRVEVCNYRLVPQEAQGYSLSAVSNSFLSYQTLFSQIHDALKNGPKMKAVIGKEAQEQSSLELAYTYGGSLGVVLLAQSERDFFSGDLDNSIDALFQVLDIDSRSSVRDIAKSLGNAVVKRVHDWSEANVNGGFAADVRWSRSDGRQLGELIERKRLATIVEIIEATSDEQTQEFPSTGILVGGDINSRSFHFVVPNGEDYRGKLASEFSLGNEMLLGKRYRATITEKSKTTYATDRIDRQFELKALNEVPPSDEPSLPSLPD